MNGRVVRLVLRAGALTIAIAAAIDPSVTSNRSVKPVVIIATPDSDRDGALASRVADEMRKEFTVLRSPIAGASAAVVVGDHLPESAADLPSPSFAILPDTTAPSVSIESVAVPRIAPSDASVPVLVRATVHGARGRSLDVSVRAGASVAKRALIRLTANDSTLNVPLSFVPTATGGIPLRVTASLSGVRTSAVANASTEVRNTSWRVLFFDPRPSWTSTFVRRAVERDGRFVVTSRTVTSRNVSTDAGQPPDRLDDFAALSRFDAVVVGAPEGLSSGEVAGLDAFMRRRGGSVVLLMDSAVVGPYNRLAGVAGWTTRTTTSSSLASAQGDSASLRATEIALPAPPPLGASMLAGGAQPVVWELATGAGRLVVSGALDAWRFRDPSASGFDRFWRMLIADEASASPPPVSLRLSSAVALPGEEIDVYAVIRDAALSTALINVDSRASLRTVRASVSAAIAEVAAIGSLGAARVALRLWPAGDVGQFVGRLRAPRTPGTYRIEVASGASTATASLIVSADLHRAAPADRDLLGAWATSRGGKALEAVELPSLAAALRAAIRPPARLEIWHPMRSWIWIVPFVLLLSGEWWLRRRRGLR